MSDETKTPVEGETKSADLGTEANAEENNQDDGANAEGESQGEKGADKPETVSKEDLDKALKALNKVTQERNLLRNQNKKLGSKVLESTEDYKTAYEELAQKVEEQEKEATAKAAREEAESFRTRVLSEYPEAVQKAAKKLIEKNPNNLIWEDAADWNDARSQLIPQLDALKEALGIEDEKEDKPIIHGNNPSSKREVNEIDAFRKLSLEDMKKQLSVADSR